VSEAANRNDSVLLPATLDEVRARGLLDAITTLHLDRGYDNGVVRAQVAAAGIDHLVVPKMRPKVSTRSRQRAMRVPLGQRWPVERTNSWLSNYGQLRRNTDRRRRDRDAQLAFVVAILLLIKVLDRAARSGG